MVKFKFDKNLLSEKFIYIKRGNELYIYEGERVMYPDKILILSVDEYNPTFNRITFITDPNNKPVIPTITKGGKHYFFLCFPHKVWEYDPIRGINCKYKRYTFDNGYILLKEEYIRLEDKDLKFAYSVIEKIKKGGEFIAKRKR